jgi:hypothetical protein
MLLVSMQFRIETFFGETTMTNTTRTVADIEANLVRIETIINSFEAHIDALRPLTSNGAQVVIGYPEEGFYVAPSGKGLVGIAFARRFDIHAAVRQEPLAYEALGHSQIVTVGLAANRAIEDTEKAITSLWGSYADDERELCERYDAMADEAAYHDQLDREWTAAGRRFDWSEYDDIYEQRRDEKAERDADARQDR